MSILGSILHQIKIINSDVPAPNIDIISHQIIFKLASFSHQTLLLLSYKVISVFRFLKDTILCSCSCFDGVKGRICDHVLALYLDRKIMRPLTEQHIIGSFKRDTNGKKTDQIIILLFC